MKVQKAYITTMTQEHIPTINSLNAHIITQFQVVVSDMETTSFPFAGEYYEGRFSEGIWFLYH